ncbi:hydantoinase/oxoprolinase family protein [Castellaniella sp. GW247-6E4]|uniref:hydantoinase/oxoprolinase family protein n=1 Tax=Castellaniella sp. GW247-6E4 TaxID=3140380 RepID=UPI003314B465
MKRKPRILGIDAGGTMTDTFVVDDTGAFVVGKAQSTPQDEAIGFMQSAEDAMRQWDLGISEGLSQIRTGIFSGTAMLNRLLERKGNKVGIIVSGGMEDYLRMERGVQTYLGYSFSDRIHTATHRHNKPLVPRSRIHGVRGRVNVFGSEVIPLYDDEVRLAVEALLEDEVQAIVVCLIFSYKNGAHEQRVKAIASEIIKTRGASVKLFLSSELYPMRQDFPRLNSTLIEAYAAEPSRNTMSNVKSRLVDAGGAFDIRVMASHGGSVSTEARTLACTLTSGPIGGVIGSRYLGGQMGIRNIACSDIGGTSFDLALITDGEFTIKQNPDIARFLLTIPLVRIDSVGSGTGSFVRVNPVNNRIEIGPDSAGSRIGTCWPEGDVSTVTITDCNVVLGYVNPDFFLGGDITLDRERAIRNVQDQLANPLGIDVYRAAAGVLELFEDHLRNSLLSQIIGRGYGAETFTCLSYGGGGPLHVAGYTDGIAFEDILIPAWAPGFSAFGCACGDYEYRVDRQLDMPLLPTMDHEARAALANAITAAWGEMADQVAEDFAKSGVTRDLITFKPGVRMLYHGQLNDLEISSPVQRLESAEDLNLICDAFEGLYGQVYGLAARTPQFGYFITSLVMRGITEVDKPILPREQIAGPDEWKKVAVKGSRKIYWNAQWMDAMIIDLLQLPAGSEIEGPAVVESPSSTMLIPPERSARLDEHRIFHMNTNAVVKPGPASIH